MLTWRHNGHKGLVQREIKKEKKIVPWYLEMPHDFPGVCVAVLHRKCVLYFHWSRISGWKRQWVFSEWDVKYFIIFSPATDVRRHAVSLKKMREKESRCHTQGFKKIPMSSKQSYHMQLEPRPSGLVTCPNWWPPLALFLPPSLGQWHPCQQLRAACLYHLQHSWDLSFIGNGEDGEGERNTS